MKVRKWLLGGGLLLATGCQQALVALNTLPAPATAVGVPSVDASGPSKATGPTTAATRNQASVSGKVVGPATLVSNNAGSIISNNAGSLVSNNTAGYRVADVQEVPVALARIVALDWATNATISIAQSDAQGRFTLAALPSDKGIVVKANYTVGSTAYQELSVTNPARATDSLAITSASTIVSAKLLSGSDPAAVDKLDLTQFQTEITQVTSHMATVSLSSLTSLSGCAQAFDALATAYPDLSSLFAKLGVTVPAVTVPTVSVPVVTVPTPSIPVVTVPNPTSSVPVPVPTFSVPVATF